MRVFITSNAKASNLLLPHTEFSYNKAPSKTIGISLFKVVYRLHPLSPLDLAPKATLEKPSMEASKRVKEIQKLYELVKATS